MIPLRCIILNFKHTSETSKPRGCYNYKIHIIIFSLVMYHLLNIFPEMRTSLLTNMTRWPHVYRAQWGELPLPSQCRSLSRICEGGSQVRTMLGLILLSFRINFLECVFLCFLYVMWMMCAGKRAVVFCGGKMWMIFFRNADSITGVPILQLCQNYMPPMQMQYRYFLRISHCAPGKDFKIKVNYIILLY